MLKAYLDYKNFITIECDKESSFKINGDSFEPIPDVIFAEEEI